MKNQKWLALLVALALMAGTAGALTWLRANQKLGKPGVIATPIPGRIEMNIGLPERVLDFSSTNVPEPEVVAGYFPKDTSYTERIYSAPDNFWVQATVVLMGADRTSIHRPEYCLPGQGWSIDEKKVVDLSIAGAPAYEMPAAKWTLTISGENSDGQKIVKRGLYIFWFVADGEQTVSHDQMLEWLTLDLFRTGALQRWAYISYFAACDPGQEDATFERMEKLIAASVPEFQLPPGKK